MREEQQVTNSSRHFVRFGVYFSAIAWVIAGWHLSIGIEYWFLGTLDGNLGGKGIAMGFFYIVEVAVSLLALLLIDGSGHYGNDLRSFTLRTLLVAAPVLVSTTAWFFLP